MEAKNCAALKNQILFKNLQVQVEQVNLPNTPFLASVEYKNIDKVWIKVSRVDENLPAKLDRKHGDEYLTALRKLEGKTWTQELPNDGYYNNHRTEIKIPELPIGQYVILIADNSGFHGNNEATAVVFTHVSNIAYSARNNSDGSNTFVITDRTTGQPLQGIQAEFMERNYNSILRLNEFKKIGTAISDKNGFITTQISSRNGYEVRFSKGDDVLRLRDYFYSHSRHRQNRNRTSTHFFLDRAIYRPGPNRLF